MSDSLESIIQDLIAGPVNSESERLDGLTFAEMCNAVALRVARQFDAGQMSFSDANAVMNSLWASVCNQPAPLPENVPSLDEVEFAVSVFEAFDAGEYHRAGDDRDPVQAYTAPMIRDVLAKGDHRR